MRLPTFRGGKRRLSLVLPQRASDRLEWLRSKTEAGSQTEVIKNALFIYDTLVQTLGTGSKVMELTSDGRLNLLALPIDVQAPRLVSIDGVRSEGGETTAGDGPNGHGGDMPRRRRKAERG